MFSVVCASLLAMIALLAVQSCVETFIYNAIMLIDTSDNASYNQVHWLIRTPHLSIKASNGLFTGRRSHITITHDASDLTIQLGFQCTVTTPPPNRDPPALYPPPIWSASGQLVSYWNAFSFIPTGAKFEAAEPEANKPNTEPFTFDDIFSGDFSPKSFSRSMVWR